MTACATVWNRPVCRGHPIILHKVISQRRRGVLLLEAREERVLAPEVLGEDGVDVLHLCGNQPVRRVLILGDDVAVLAPSSGEEPASPRHRAGVASMAWRSTRRFRTNAP